MDNIIKIISFLVIFVSSSFADDFLLKFKQAGTVRFNEDSKKYTSESGKEGVQFRVRIDYEKSRAYMIVGNQSAELMILSYNKIDDVIYLAEITPGDNVNIITLLMAQNVAIFSKQYVFLGRPFGTICIGDLIKLK